MADDRMRNDDLDRNMGGGQQGQQKGSQSPGRNPEQDDLSTGKRGTGQDQEAEPRHIKDDFGTSGKSDVGEGRQNQ